MSSSQFSRVWTTSYSRGSLQNIEVQALVRRGLPRFDIVGLPQNMIREGKDRIMASLHSLGLELPAQKLLIHLNPGDVPKEGTHMDLPILVAILNALGILPYSDKKIYCWGELQLDGSIRSTPDLLAHLLFIQELEIDSLFSGPVEAEFEEVQKYLRYPVQALNHVQDFFSPLTNNSPQNLNDENVDTEIRNLWLQEKSESSLWNHLRGKPEQFHIMAICSLGRLHCLLEGSPGVGKSSWSRALDELQRPLERKYWGKKFSFRSSSLNISKSFQNLVRRPFESPHHTSSSSSIIGGGTGQTMAGSITRANQGILFLDEMPEFHRDVLEALREPLEDKKITIGRSTECVQLPADVQIIAAMNPCPCGNHASNKMCTCSSSSFWRYRTKISEPLRDRFHLQIWWRFYEQKIEAELKLNSIRRRLIQSEKWISKPMGIQLPQFSSPRKKIRFLETLIAWAKWWSLSEITQGDVQEFEDFLKELEVFPYEFDEDSGPTRRS